LRPIDRRTGGIASREAFAMGRMYMMIAAGFVPFFLVLAANAILT
jgi:hypothetical protein